MDGAAQRSRRRVTARDVASAKKPATTSQAMMRAVWRMST
jgi:hypothetical protein